MLEPDRNYEFDGFADGPPATPVGLPRARGGGVERMDQGGMGPMGLDTAFVSLGSGFDNPALAGAAAVGGQMLAGEVTRMQSKVGGWVNMASLRFYFAVSNSYVLNKFKRLLLPFLYSQWTPMNPALGMDGVSHRVPPTDDINAPDLYIPLVSLVTYVLLCGYFQGVQQSFTPEVLGSTLSSSLVALAIESSTLKLGFYLTNAPRQLPFLDAVAFAGYKFVYIIACSVVGINFGSFPFTAAILVAGILSSIFLVRALKEFFGPVSASLSKRNSLFLFVVLLQFAILFFMGQARSPILDLPDPVLPTPDAQAME